MLLYSYGYEYGNESNGVVFIIVVILLVSIVINGVIAEITGSIARKKGRSFKGWFCLSFFLLGIIALIIITCLPDTKVSSGRVSARGGRGDSVAENNKKQYDGWICDRCGQYNIHADKFCVNCGMQKLSDWVCPDCGHSNPYGNKYCGGCGKAKPE